MNYMYIYIYIYIYIIHNFNKVENSIALSSLII